MTSARPPYGRPPTARGGAPLRLGHLVPERLPVVLERTNPEWTSLSPDDPRRDEVPETIDVILQGYVFGARCPGVVKAELASIEEAYMHAVNRLSAETDTIREAGGDGASPVSTSGFVGAWHTFLRETITALIPGITPGEADVLAAVPPGEEGPGTDLLRYLGVWRRAGGTANDDPPVPTTVPEEDPPPITVPSSPTSSPSTASDPPSS